MVLHARRFWLFRQCIHPGMITGWWPEDVAKELQKFYFDLEKRPAAEARHHGAPAVGQSIAVTHFIAWVAGRSPDLKIIFASYSDTLGERTCLDLQRILAHENYIKIFRKASVPPSEKLWAVGLCSALPARRGSPSR